MWGLTSIFRKAGAFALALHWVKFWDVLIINFTSFLRFQNFLLDYILLVWKQNIFAQIFALYFCWLFWLVVSILFLYFKQVLFRTSYRHLWLLVTIDASWSLSALFVLIVELTHVARLTFAHFAGAPDLRLRSVTTDASFVADGNVTWKGLHVSDGWLSRLKKISSLLPQFRILRAICMKLLSLLSV
jgi:hypothetical protein